MYAEHVLHEPQVPIVAGIDGVARLDDGRLVYANPVPPYGMMAERTLIDPAGAVELPGASTR